ncbi:MAG: hypothetical protein COT73_08535, partial [Bdellovibrio sp. CG10_big_fil_rev_8_21_14_0_10_47_8]
MESTLVFWHDPGLMILSKTTDHLHLHLESILDRELEMGATHLTLTGTASTSLLGLLLSHANS